MLEEYSKDIIVPIIDKDKLVDLLAEELLVIRAKIGLSQEDLSNITGISCQTYSTIETGKKNMTWSTFLSMLFVFSNNEKNSTTFKSLWCIS